MSDLSRDEILSFYTQLPFGRHPLWNSILQKKLSLEQILRAETQHYIRSNVGRWFRKKAADEAMTVSKRAASLLRETYKEECTEDESGPSHVVLIRRLLEIGGVASSDIDNAVPTPGNSAAIALYQIIGERGPLHHMIGAGAVEYFYSELSPRVFQVYTSHYGMTPEQAETYQIHGPMDREHAERALSILGEVPRDEWPLLRLSVRDAFVATSLHYDGMLQAACGHNDYWNGK